MEGGEGGCVYVVVCNCKTEHATVDLLDLILLGQRLNYTKEEVHSFFTKLLPIYFQKKKT